MAKSLLPSLREKKRYVAFEVISNSKPAFSEVKTAVDGAVRGFLGQKGASQVGAIMLKERFKSPRGIVRVNHTEVDSLRASFCMVKNVGKQRAIIRSLGTSGILKKAYSKYVETNKEE